MKYNFCTLFDSTFLAKGLALYSSLEQTGIDFHLYVYAFDNLAFQTLQKLQLPKATIISLEDFEDAELLRVKSERSIAEYCWTCTPSIILYSIEQFGLSMCTYIDSDLYFFSSPAPLFDEFGDDSILLVEHRYPAGREKDLLYGKYCVQFNSFRNDAQGMRALRWWRDQCIRWCSIVPESGKFGDQKYLDDWPERFAGVHELKHLGGGVAPWNVIQYKFFEKNGKVYGQERQTENVFPLIFYHFHRTAMYNIAGGLRIKSAYLEVNQSTDLQTLVYHPYRSALTQAIAKLHHIDRSLEFPFEPFRDYLKKMIRDHTPKFISATLRKFGLRMNY